MIDKIKKILLIDNDADWEEIVTKSWNKMEEVSHIDVEVDLRKIETKAPKPFDDELKLLETELLACDKLQNYDLIFLDLYLTETSHGEPEPSGQKVLEMFKKFEERFIYVPPVIILSGSHNLDRALKLTREYGAFDYLCKSALRKLGKEIKEKKWEDRLNEDLGLAQFIENRNLKAGVMAVKRIAENQPERFWFGNKVYAIVDHLKIHALGVWKILYYLLKNSPIIKNGVLKRDENLYILLMSALLHDIGHCGNEQYSLPVEVRSLHGLISDYLINEDPLHYGFVDFPSTKIEEFTKKDEFAQAVGLISKYHEGKVPITKDQKRFFNKNLWDLELFELYYNSMCFEEECEKRLKEKYQMWEMNLLLALLMFADATHISRERVGEEEVVETRLQTLKREGTYWLQKILIRIDSYLSQVAQMPGIGVSNLQIFKEEIGKLFKLDNKTFDNWLIESEDDARRWYQKLQTIVPIYDHDFLKQIEYVSFLKKQEKHYDKHFPILNYPDFVTSPFVIEYVLDKSFSGKKEVIEEFIKKDLSFELERIGDIVNKKWDGFPISKEALFLEVKTETEEKMVRNIGRISELFRENDLGQKDRESLRILDDIVEEIERILRKSEWQINSGEELQEKVKIDSLNINCIPGAPTDNCYPILVVYCIGKDNFQQRLQECVNCAGIYCHGTNRFVLFVTDKWNTSDWKNIADHPFRFLHRKFKVYFIRVLVEPKGLTITRFY